MNKKYLIFSAIVMITMAIALMVYFKDPLAGQWRSDKGDSLALIDSKGKDAPFIIDIRKDVFYFQNKEYKILHRTTENDGRIFLKTENFTLKIKFADKDDIIFIMPGIGSRRYKKI